MQTYEFNFDEYKKKTKSHNSHSILIMSLIIIILLPLCIVLSPKPRNNKYYFVRINTFLSYKDALNVAQELQSKSAGGYIHFDGKYHVLANFYPSEDEAITVVDNLSPHYPNTNVFVIEADNLSRNSNDTILDMVDCQDNTINQLFGTILQLDKDELSPAQAHTVLRQIRDRFNSERSNFVTLYKTSKDSNIIKCCVLLDNIASSLDKICDLSPAPNLYQYKYELMSITFDYFSFLDSL